MISINKSFLSVDALLSNAFTLQSHTTRRSPNFCPNVKTRWGERILLADGEREQEGRPGGGGALERERSADGACEVVRERESETCPRLPTVESLLGA